MFWQNEYLNRLHSDTLTSVKSFYPMSLLFPKHSHKSKSFWEMRQVHAFAMTSNEMEKDADDDREEKRQVEPGQPATQLRDRVRKSRNPEDT